jgi:hypothetical protein
MVVCRESEFKKSNGSDAGKRLRLKIEECKSMVVETVVVSCLSDYEDECGNSNKNVILCGVLKCC